MSNAVVYGKAPPVQVIGAQSSGAFFQNLGTNPVFVGYDTGVSSTYCDGVIQPGGTYNSGPNKAVWLYADVDSPVVYNEDSGAAADSGTSATVTGAVSVNGTVPVTAPSTLPVAQQGIVTVQGTTKVQQMAQATLLAQPTFTIANGSTSGGGSLPAITGLNNYASLLVGIQQGNLPSGFPQSGALITLWVEWDNVLDTPSFYYFYGTASLFTDYFQIPCLGNSAVIKWNYQSPAASPGAFQHMLYCYGSNLPVPKPRYSQGAGQSLDPTLPFNSTAYGGSTGAFKNPVPSTSGRFFASLRNNSSTGAARLYVLSQATTNGGIGETAITSVQYPASSPIADSKTVELPGMLAPLSLQISIVTVGAMVITSQAESV